MDGKMQAWWFCKDCSHYDRCQKKCGISGDYTARKNRCPKYWFDKVRYVEKRYRIKVRTDNDALQVMRMHDPFLRYVLCRRNGWEMIKN